MEFSAQKPDFAAAAQTVLRAVTGKSDIGGGILIEADAETITLSATDSELGIKSRFRGQVGAAGEVVLPGRHLADLVRRLPPGPVDLKYDAFSGHVYLDCGASHFELLSLPIEQFPRFGDDEPQVLATVPELTFRTAVNQVAFAAARDGLRQLLNSVLISFEQQATRLVATDGHRLAMIEIPELIQDLSGEYLVPAKSMEEAARLISGQEEVHIAGTAKQLSFRTASTLLQTRLVEGKYLPYDSIIPTEFSVDAVVLRSELLAALERAELFTSDKINAVALNLTDDGIALSAESAEIGRVREQVPAEVHGAELDISFNVRYLLDPLKILNSEEIRIRFTGPQSAAVIGYPENDLYRYLVMPITTRGGV